MPLQRSTLRDGSPNNKTFSYLLVRACMHACVRACVRVLQLLYTHNEAADDFRQTQLI